MVSSYLICDQCGQFGPPAGFVNQGGLRLCYQCWYQEQQDNAPDAHPSATGSTTDPAGKGERFEPDREP
ncbi:hypothetical protein [Candidatus Contendibacter odensensis]|uniref:Uncharacterized protein n=1 Tax=Candidatus Contendobacter odensis Run_B_J11 TaxID=1400861 RepID=A0A7U7GEW9_9GAMM|nr:hypothetical protein [Candidatus Contendobacter odensis]MBK8752498.1 hypothetical protein [Candidatus Competibacteraceae bacterium]CDH46999.1 hypothetical protein BN874_690049 [Candidatus Contendobacter odensis Run_B_J11]